MNELNSGTLKDFSASPCVSIVQIPRYLADEAVVFGNVSAWLPLADDFFRDLDLVPEIAHALTSDEFRLTAWDLHDLATSAAIAAGNKVSKRFYLSLK